MADPGIAEDSFLKFLSGNETTLSAELRPPRANTSGRQSMDDWIDIYHSIRRITIGGSRVFITDSAVAQHEEENLRHLVINLGSDARRSRIVPFLTTKHTMDYCLRYAERAYEQGFRTLVVLGGDRLGGAPRCVSHAWELRREIRKRVPEMELGGWANPQADAAQQVEYLAREEETADFFLTQVVSHHSAHAVARFMEELERRRVRIPAVFGVFYYRSAKEETLQFLQQFFHVPADGLRTEFAVEKQSPDEVCARSIQKLQHLGIRHIYVSNLPASDAAVLLGRLLDATGPRGTEPQA
jgi:5,10-methylenetetrahydrofolate reductase